MTSTTSFLLFKELRSLMNGQAIQWKTLSFMAILLLYQGCFDLKPAPGPTECDMCTRNACPEKLADCMNSASCRSRYDCLVKCDYDDADCRSQCPGGHIRDDQLALALDICRSANCMNECDKCGASMFDGRGAACSLCIQKQQCCPKATACALDAECSETMRARYSCDDPFCAMNDGLSYDGTRTRLSSTVRTDLESCLETCNEDCRLGTDYSCHHAYGNPTLSEADPPTTAVTLIPRDMWDGKLIHDVKMEAVGGNTNNGQGEMTDLGDGTYRYSVSGEYVGYFRVEKEGYLPTRLYFSRFLVGNEHWSIPLIQDNVGDLFSILLGETIDIVNYGVLIINAYDCTHTFARGLQTDCLLEHDESNNILKFYAEKAGYNPDATATGELGSAVYFQVPESKTIMNILLKDNQEHIGFMDLTIVKGEVTWAAVFPNPHIWGGS